MQLCQIELRNYLAHQCNKHTDPKNIVLRMRKIEKKRRGDSQNYLCFYLLMSLNESVETSVLFCSVYLYHWLFLYFCKDSVYVLIKIFEGFFFCRILKFFSGFNFLKECESVQRNKEEFLKISATPTN